MSADNGMKAFFLSDRGHYAVRLDLRVQGLG